MGLRSNAFNVNQIYTLDKIRNDTENIGNHQACLPFSGPVIPYGQFRRQLNPNFPRELWIEEGPHREQATKIWQKSKAAIPIFEHVNNGYVFMGYLTPKDFITNSVKIQQMTGGLQPRGAIAVIIVL